MIELLGYLKELDQNSILHSFWAQLFLKLKPTTVSNGYLDIIKE